MIKEMPFSLIFENLPEQIPIFPLEEILLLPRGRLPLNIFEPRYLAMTLASLKADRLIGMVQPQEGKNGPGSDPDQPGLYNIGCAGRIVSFTETLDDRFEITLEGVCRFEIAEELEITDGFRSIRPDWNRFRGDFTPQSGDVIDMERLEACVRPFLKLQGIQAEWQIISTASDENLITSLAMGFPFAANEKQALLEAPSLGERAQILISLVEMALIDTDNSELTCQ